MATTLISENEFTKAYKCNDVEIWLQKAYDEDSDGHYIIANIPIIPELKIERIQYPMLYENEKTRDDMFRDFNETYATNLVDGLIAHIKKQKEENEIHD